MTYTPFDAEDSFNITEDELKPIDDLYPGLDSNTSPSQPTPEAVQTQQLQQEAAATSTETATPGSAQSSAGSTDSTKIMPGDPRASKIKPPEGEEGRYKWNPEVGEYEMKSGAALKDVAETIAAPAVGTLDGFTDIANFFLSPTGAEIPKLPKFENNALQTIRDVSSFIGPTISGIGAMKWLGKAAHARVGWQAGNSPVLRIISEAGIDIGVSTAVGQTNANQKEPGNIYNLTQNLLNGLGIKQFDGIAADLGTFEGQDPDYIRRKNTEADAHFGALLPVMQLLGKYIPSTARAIKAKTSVTRNGLNVPSRSERVADAVGDGLELTGNNSQSSAALKELQPDDRLEQMAGQYWDSTIASADPEGIPDAFPTRQWAEMSKEDKAYHLQGLQELGIIPKELPPTTLSDEYGQVIVDYAMRQEEALDELGRYNLSNWTPEDGNIAMKGVHDLFDYNELGMRTVDDFGVVGAAVDQARIANNAGTSMGRIRNMVSPAAMKYTARNLDAVDDITLGLTKSLDDINDFSAAGRGWSLTNDDIAKAGEDLVIEFFDPSMDVNSIRRVLSPYIGKNADGVEVLAPGGYNIVFDQLVKMGKEFNDMDVAKAQAYVGTSLAGQISDVAEAARLNRASDLSVQAAQEKIIDNMKFLMRLKGSTNYYRNMKNGMANMWRASGTVSDMDPASLKANYNSAMEVLNREIDMFADDLDYTFKNYPELGESIMELFEMTDGRVFSIETVQDTLKKSLGWANPLRAADPETPNLISQAARGNYYNSMLSAMGTPVRATMGNIGGVIEEPIAYFAGAALRGNVKEIQKGMMAYNALGTMTQKAFPLMKQLYRRASQNIETVEAATDLDFVLKTDRKINALRKLGNTEAERGNLGAQIMIEHYLTLQEMAQDPVLKFSSNAMTGLDGFPQAFMANGEARFRAMEALERNPDLDPNEFLKIANSEYNSMFDSSGALLKDKAAKYSSDVISLRANTELAASLNQLVEKFPPARLLFPFPGTMANAFNLVDSTIPAPLRSFQKDINELAYTSMDTFSENPALVRDILESRGYNVNEMDEIAQLGAISRLKNKTLGRKGITSFLMGAASTMFFAGRITGDGLYDRQAQTAREQVSTSPKRSFMGLDGKWYSYEQLLGPGYANWVAQTINILDNANYIGTGKFENLEKKLGLVLAATLKEESGLSALEPLFDLFDGNEKSIKRWAATRINSLGPLAGFRREMGELLNGGIRIIDGDIQEYLLNQNKVLGTGDSALDLPKYTNPLTGEVPNEFNPIQRLWNNFSPVKVGTKPTENQLFLHDIGYSYTSMFKTKEGVDLLPDEREALFASVGRDGAFKREVTRIRKQAERNNFLEKLRAYRDSGADEQQLEEFMTIQGQIRDAAKTAEALAFAKLDYKYLSAINKRIEEKNLNLGAARIGITEFIDSTPTR